MSESITLPAEIGWQVNPHLWFQADYGIFHAGTFLKEIKPGLDLHYWELWAGYKFQEESNGRSRHIKETGRVRNVVG
jgi:hypothetical protein